MAPIAREEVTDEVLMLRFQSGDRSAFAALVRKHKTPIYNFVLRLVRTPSVAEDLVQDVFVKIVQSAVDFKHESKFSTWAYAIARNICIDHLRKMTLPQARFARPGRRQRARRADAARSNGRRSSERHRRPHRHRTGGRAAHHRVRREPARPISARCSCCARSATCRSRRSRRSPACPENTVKSRMRYALERLQESLAEYEDYARALR